MTITSRLSRALKLVKAFEAFHARAAPQDGGFVIGYGHTASAREGATVTREEADDLLIYDLGQIGDRLDAWVYAPMHDNQRQALIAFGFNIGVENLHRSTALRRLNAGDYMGCAREIERWRMAELAGRGQIVDALVRRRAAEKALFLTPADGFLKTESVRLRPRFDGERTPPAPVAEAPIEPTSAAMTAAQNVSARLRALLPDLDEPGPMEAPVAAQEAEESTAGANVVDDTPDQPELDLSPAIEPAPTDPSEPAAVPDRDAAAEAAFLDSIVLEPIRLEPAPPQWRSAPTPAVETLYEAGRDEAPDRVVDEAPPPPFIPAARYRGPSLVSANDHSPDSFNDETLAHAAPHDDVAPAAAASDEMPPVSPAPSVRERLAPLLALIVQRGHLLFGIVGLVLFALSIVLILTGKPSVTNLIIGLVGVLCMTPSAYSLLGAGRRN
ncbi:MAG: lysozyme [Caulobacteraceae bacterium]